MSNMLELSVNLGPDAVTKVTVSNTELHQGFFNNGEVTPHHFKVSSETKDWIYLAVIKEDVLAKLGNPSEVWIYVE